MNMEILASARNLNLEYLISGVVMTIFAFAFMFYEAGQIVFLSGFTFEISTLSIPIYATGLGTMVAAFFRRNNE